MPATVILNPYANRWNAGEKQADLESSLKNAGVDYELKISEWAGHSIELATKAAKAGNFPLVAVGGDGTCSEVVNGTMQAIGRPAAAIQSPLTLFHPRRRLSTVHRVRPMTRRRRGHGLVLERCTSTVTRALVIGRRRLGHRTRPVD